MIERVARAIEPAAYGPTCASPDFYQKHARELARAAIEAMREPTEDMVRAMRGRALYADCLTDRGARDIYSNIVHAALKQG